jgi:hypothetical protein
MLIHHLALMIIGQFDVICIAVHESKANPPLVVHGDGILSLPIMLQLVQPIARRNLQIVHVSSQIEIFQPSQDPLAKIRRKSL